ncbi:porin family protein [Rufibacter sp. XAAS-G3-1]|uniref:porin family protein n=1 Tax=Rufibacter sp. XAAS-G3-1 TaxID=2729134 RepID=UPI0015E6BBA5|nr:porin family protein [Rufibacter sp. XAAS-G3-1]
MKKLVVLVAAVFTSYFAQAQTGISLGLKAGVNYSTIMADDDEGIKYKPDFHVGGFAEYSISDMVSIKPELLYSRKGAKYSFSASDQFIDGNGETQTITGEVDAKMTFQYLELPVLAKVKAGNLFFEAGPTFGYLLKSTADIKSSFSGGGMDFSYDGSDDGTDDMKRFEFGYAAGIGYELPSGLGLTLRYNGGLSDLNKETEEDPEEEELAGVPSGKIKNSVFQCSLSYRFAGR